MLFFWSQAWTQEIPSLSQRIWEDGSGVGMIEFGNWWKKKVKFLYGVFCLEFQSLQEESRIESEWSTTVIKVALHNFYLSTSNMYCLQCSCTLSVSSYPLCFLQLSLAGCNFLIGMWNTLLCFLKQNVNHVTHGK